MDKKTKGADPAQSAHSEDDAVWKPVSIDDLQQPDPSQFPDVGNTQVDDQTRPDLLPLMQPAGRLRSVGFKIDGLTQRPRLWLQTQVNEEVTKGAYFLWAPVIFGLGCIIYFNLPREPVAGAFAFVSVSLFALAKKVRQASVIYRPVLVVALLAGGVAAAHAHTAWLDTPMLSRTGVATLTGRVLRAEHRADGRVRYTIVTGSAPAKFDMRGVTTNPGKLRITARKGGEAIPTGDYLSGRAMVGPPSGPAFPGAYDFSFNAWHSGIGASGFFLGQPKRVIDIQAQPMKLFDRAGLWIETTRGHISNLIREALPGKTGGLAAALIVGDRSGVDADTAEDLRRSGLAHILAISGLHMALVALTVVIVLRALFACFSNIALNYPVRKWASGAALAAATVYLLLSGANVSTQRAYIMVAIMLVAVLIDRRGLTMRNIAIAAFIVLVIAPHAILSPGFQMSFAAVAALIATYEITTRYRSGKTLTHRAGIVGAVQRFFTRDVAGLALTSLIAGIATALYAAFHFYRIAPLGLLANVLAMPLVTFAVMPFALISALMMPFGLESFPLQVMSVTLEWVVSIADWVSGLGAEAVSGKTGLVPVATVLCGTAALFLVTLMRSMLKLIALPFMIMAAFFLQTREMPDVVVLENGKQIGLLDGQEGLVLLRPNAEKFNTRIWSSAFDLPIRRQNNRNRRAFGDRFQCDEFGCVTRFKGKTITYLTSTARLTDDCRLSDILVIPYDVEKACAFLPENQRPYILDRTALKRSGSQSIWIEPMKVGNVPTSIVHQSTEQDVNLKTRDLKVQQSYPIQNRPWNRHRAN